MMIGVMALNYYVSNCQRDGLIIIMMFSLKSLSHNNLFIVCILVKNNDFIDQVNS